MTRKQPKLLVELRSHNWLDYEQRAGLSLCDVLEKELRKLKARATASRVHDARVAMRRFLSVWSVMKEDGWQSRKSRRNAIRPLRKLLRILGRLRDLDVMVDTGKRLGCPPDMLKAWRQERAATRKTVRDRIAQLDVETLIDRLRTHLATRPEKIKASLNGHKKLSRSAFRHLERYLVGQEDAVRELEQRASTPEDLHELRLEVKRWRYLLMEFFGIKDAVLTQAQQVLGTIHDLDRMEDLLQGDSARPALLRLRRERARLLGQFGGLRRQLPYGLRPGAG